MNTRARLFSLFGFLFFILYSLFFYSVPITSAQVGLTSADVSVAFNPENPYPNQTVVISLDSYATDLNAATITWLVNGKKVASGKGVKQMSVTTGNLGVKTTVNITIDTQLATIQKDFSITPSSVDLIWEANTYTPPFFKGRPLYTAESTVTFVAVPHVIRNGSEINPLNLIYKWEINGTVLGDKSGYAKNSLTVVGTILPRPMDIHVEATDSQSGLLAAGDTSIAPGIPFVLFYKNDPLYGVEYQRALTGTYPLTDKEIEITAVPYYFSTKSSSDSNLSYTWGINGVPINDGQNSPNKVFRQVGDVFGTSNISLSVAQTQTMFQVANTSLIISFQKQTGLTGL